MPMSAGTVVNWLCCLTLNYDPRMLLILLPSIVHSVADAAVYVICNLDHSSTALHPLDNSIISA